MESDSQRRTPSSFRGPAGLIVAVAAVLLLLAGLPTYRWFFLISLGIGLLVAAILFLWNKHKPIKAEDVDKRPLKLE